MIKKRLYKVIRGFSYFVPFFISLMSYAQSVSVLDNYTGDLVDHFVHQQWTIDDGMPVNAINSIIQGDEGYIWMATYDGLVRFNGVQFKVYQRKDYPDIGNNRMDLVQKDSQNRLWIFGEKEALIKYENNEFTTFNKSNGFTDGEIRTIVESSQGVLWIGTTDGIYTYKDDTLHRAYDYGIRDLVFDHSETLWIATPHQLFSIKGNTKKEILSYEPGSGDEIIKLHLALDRSIWVATTDELYRYNNSVLEPVNANTPHLAEDYAVFLNLDEEHVIVGGDNGFHLISQQKNQIREQHFLAGVDVRSMNKDSQDRVWIVDWTGKVFLFNPPTETVNNVSEQLGLTNSRLNNVIEDREGNLWFSSDPGGLHQLKPALVHNITSEEGLSVNNTLSVLEDSSATIWVGTRDGGLNRISPDGITSFLYPESIPHEVVHSIAQDSSGTIWAGMYRQGVVKIDPQGTQTEQVEGLDPNSAVYAILNNHQGTWLGTENGLVHLQGNNKTIYTQNDGLPHYIVRVIIEDKKGGLWLGTNGGGIAYFMDGKVEQVFNEGNGLSSNRVRSIHIDEEDEKVIWVGTEDHGLSRIEEGKITTYGTEHGLHDEVIHQILEHKGRLWMSTNRGIFYVEKKQLNDFATGETDRIFSRVFGKREGMQNIEGNGGSQYAGIKTQDNKLIFASQAGIAIIDPDELPEESASFPIVIEEIIIGNKEHHPGEVQNLPSDTRAMEIRYAALSYRAPGRIEYAYMIEGIDKEWNQVGTRQTAYYTNLDYGEYTFKVKARNIDGSWSEEVAGLNFSIAPEFYETTWFYLLSFLLGISSLVIMGRAYGNYKERRQAYLDEIRTNEREHIREKLAADFHDEFGTRITRLGLLIKILQQGRKKENGDILHKMEDNTNALYSETRDFIWQMDPKKDSLFNIFGWLKKFGEEFFENSRIDFVSEPIPAGTEEISIEMEPRSHIFRIFKEAMNNAQKYSGASKCVFSVELSKEKALVCLSDNGKGMELAQCKHKGNGLSNMKERAKQSGGSLYIQSEPGKGTQIIYEFMLG